MLRQRYIENSGFQGSFYKSVSVASHPAKKFSSARHFVHEQRKIIANFKAQPWPMQMKMAARKTYMKNLSEYTNKLNTVDSAGDYMLQFIKRIKRKLNNFVDYITIWRSIIKQIEGNFGSSVASFFTFLRWMCALNVVLSIIILGLVVIPQGIGGQGLDVPPAVKSNRSAFSFVIDGTGYEFEFSVLFYGYYDSGQPLNSSTHPLEEGNPHPYISWGYRLPLVYILTIGAMFFICIIASVISMARNYKVLQRANYFEQYMFAWKIFASWDFTIINSEMVKAKARQITVILKESILEAEKKINKGTKWYLYCIRSVSQIVVFIILVVSCYGVYLTVEISRSGSTTYTISDAFNAGFKGVHILLTIFQVQLAIISRNFLLPYIFKFAEIIEKHHPRTKLKIMLIRLFMLYVTSLYVVIIALLTSNNRCTIDGSTNSTAALIGELTTLRDNRDRRSIDNTHNTVPPYCCWETTIGQELFKLTITHFLAELFSIGANDIGRWAIVHSKFSSKFTRLVGLADFRLADNVLRLIYGQALVWLGILFCPLLVLINSVKIILLFYIRAIAVSIFNQPPKTMFRIASTRNFYLAILLTVTFLCIFPVGYAMIQIVPSMQCGPYRGLKYMLEIVMNEIASLPPMIRQSVELFQSGTIIIPAISLLLIVIFYYVTMVSALKDVNKDLRLQLHMEQEEIKERIAREAQKQKDHLNALPRKPLSVKSRHKELMDTMLAENGYKSHQITSNQLSHTTPTPRKLTISSEKPVSFPQHEHTQSFASQSRMNKSHVEIKDIDDIDDSTLTADMTPVVTITQTQHQQQRQPPYIGLNPAITVTGWTPPPPNTEETDDALAYKETAL